ncbi:MAG: ABC transporter substrate-binding protein [Pseudarthrobacter sp.]
MALVLLLLAGCATKPAPSGTQTPATPAPAAQSGPKPGGQLVIAKEDNAPGLDPHKIPATTAIRVFELMYDGLVKLDKDMVIQPNLAESWTVGDSGKTYTFKLRKGVKFHNGRELTSADVKYSYERILDEKTGALIRSFFGPVIDGIETPDAQTVVFKLKAANAPFLQNVASFWAAIVPKEVVDQNNGDLSRVAVGTGPFKLGEWVQDNYIVLNRFDDYFGGKPLLDSVKFVVLKDEAARLAAVRTGQVHMSLISAQSAALLKSEKDVKVISSPSLRYYYLGMNHARKPFDNVKVRQAVALALDRQQLINVALAGEGVLTGPTPPALKEWAIPGDQFPMNKRDVAKAKQLLAEAGYPNGFQTTLTSASNRDDFQDMAQLIQSQLAEVGIKVTITPVEWAKYVDTWRAKGMDMTVGFNGGATDIDRSLHFYWSSAGGANVWNFASKDLDSLIDKARVEPEAKNRYQPYADAQKLVVDQVVNAFLASPNKFLAIRGNVRDYTPMPNDQNLYLPKTWLDK